MKIFLGADHGGYEQKEEIKKWLLEKGEEVMDLGAMELNDGDDFVDYAYLVAEKLQKEGGRGILLCKNGVGVSIAANRFTGVRCALAFDEEEVRRARMDDDVNCLALAADYFEMEEQKKMIEVFLKTEFTGEERFTRRIGKLEVEGKVVNVDCDNGVCQIHGSVDK